MLGYTKPVHIASASSSGLVCANVEVANSFLKRLVGLLGRKSLAIGSGLWLSPSSGIHTFGMRFAIDVIALDAEMKVVELHREVRAWKIAATSSHVHSVLELPSGQIDASGLSLGETITIDALKAA